MRVLIADKLSPRVIKELESAGCEVTVDGSLKDEPLRDALAKIDPNVLVVRSTKVTTAHFQAAGSLSLVIRAGAGTNTIAIDTASERAVYVANCPGKNAIAVAELVMGHLINLDRRIVDNANSLREHVWAKKEYGKSRGLFGRTLAVLGTGRIGAEVITRAQAFGMHVKAWDKVLTPELAADLGVEYCATALDACTGADALTVHVGFNAQTRNLIDETLLRALAPGAYVIQAARGGVLDEDAFARVAEERDLRGGFDVYTNEPAASDNAFGDAIADNPRVYGTHHIGASTEQASEAVGSEVLRIILAFKDQGCVLNCVNLDEHPPASHMLVVRHADKVGVLAGVLDLLREGQVNVQEMENKIFLGGKAACASIQLSDPPDSGLLDRIQGSAHIIATSLVALED